MPESAEEVCLCAVRPGEPGLFLLSTRDVVKRAPIVTDNGKYELGYKVFARDFPLLEFTVTLDLQWQPAASVVWENRSNVSNVTVTV